MIALVPLSLSAILAQGPALKDVHRVLPPFRPTGSVQAFGDVNGDSLADVVIVGPQGSSDVWIAAANGAFSRRPGAFPPLTGICNGMVLVDVDGDGDLDCVTAHAPTGASLATGADRIFVNNGTGTFQESTHSPLPSSTSASTCIAAADIDGDVDLDLVVGTPVTSSPGPFPTGGENNVYVNDGGGQFTLENNRMPSTWCDAAVLVFLDHDGDGDADLVSGNRTIAVVGVDRLFVNDGLGSFTSMLLTGSATGESTQHIAARDFDADGDTDLLLVKTVYPSVPALRHLRNGGTGGFTVAAPAPPSVAGLPTQLLVGDWNRDLRTDYALRYAGGVHTFVSTPAGQFQPSQLPIAWFGERPVLAGDLDCDGDSDLLAAPAHLPGPSGSVLAAVESEELRNLGNRWATLPPRELPVAPMSVGMRQDPSDIDRDGHLDVIWSPTRWTTGRIFRGAGTGTFVEVPPGAFGVGQFQARSTVFGDVDGDGDTDIVCGVDNGAGYPVDYSRLFLQASGTFVAGPFPAVTASLAAIGDVDGDNDLDLLLADQLHASILANDGSGAFSVLSSALPAGLATVRGGWFADFDGDGDLDIAASGDSLLLNDGSGHFTTTAIPGFPALGSVMVIDFDGDQDPDLLAGSPGARRQLFLNDGSGTFSMQVTPLASDSLLTAVDLDADGRCDFVEYTTDSTSSVTTIWWNTGASGLVNLPGSVVDASHGVWSMLPGDFDEDGDVDVLAGGEAATFVYRNLRHQLAWRTLPRVGFSLAFDLFGRANGPWLLGMSFAQVSLPLGGFGTLHLDPAALLVVASGQYDGSGRSAFSVFVPPVPALVGASVHWQALSVVPLRLGNLETTVLQGG